MKRRERGKTEVLFLLVPRVQVDIRVFGYLNNTILKGGPSKMRFSRVATLFPIRKRREGFLGSECMRNSSGKFIRTGVTTAVQVPPQASNGLAKRALIPVQTNFPGRALRGRLSNRQNKVSSSLFVLDLSNVSVPVLHRRSVISMCFQMKPDFSRNMITCVL